LNEIEEIEGIEKIEEIEGIELKNENTKVNLKH
jgi:hypothetical protein